ncbi:MAG: hypothetical protein C0603_07675 [Denitrovibrio sp.]|nr:MAG: hypothetical protein C0603_07675 [Denitrovibrio sp.]
MLKLTDIQILKLGKTLHHIHNNNFFYGQKFPAGRLSSYSEFCSLPFMTYEILAQGYPFAYSCADTKALTSGHLQKVEKLSVMNLYTDNDNEHIAEMISRSFSIAGITDEDTIILISNESCSSAYIKTSDKLKHFIIHGGSLAPKKLYQLIKDTNATCLLGDTTDLIKFVDLCRDSSFDLLETELRTGIFSGKPLTNGTRKHIEKETGMEIFQTSSFGDFLAGFASDCKEHDGMHVWDDHYLAEILDKKTGKPVKDGEEGELIVTTLSLSALPLIRFKTGKISKIVSREKCECGLHTIKIAY